MSHNLLSNIMMYRMKSDYLPQIHKLCALLKTNTSHSTYYLSAPTSEHDGSTKK